MNLNLEELNTARDRLIPSELRSFTSYFIGAISRHVPHDVWERGIEAAINCVKKDRRRDDTRRSRDNNL